MIFGVHVSTSGGLVKACDKVHEMGANGMQIFTGSPRIWKGKMVNEYGVDGVGRAVKKYGIEYVVIHATYLVNLASDKPELVGKSVDSLVNDMRIADKLAREMGQGSVGVVVHLGSHQGRGYQAMREHLVKEIGKVLKQSPERARFLMENSAGQNGKIASDLEEVKDLLGGVDDERLGWCLDTCHAHANGYWLGRTQNSKLKTNNDNSKVETSQQGGLFDADDGEKTERLVVDEIDRLGLWERLWCVHVNDSRDPFGSGRDRHANLGDGLIPRDDLKEFLSTEQVKQRPLILEVPGVDNKGPDEENVERLKRLVG